jgi:hypothetical protein
MPRIALGLFHFNPQYVAGDPDIANRYCREALDPFLTAVAQRPRWRPSLAMAGSGLEFVAEHHPSSFDLLQQLVQADRMELISALYAPSIWVAFPRRDLMRAVALNRQCLAALGLRDAGIFFAQEAFFGPGVASVASEFRFALCKDEYVEYFAGEAALSPCYQLGPVRVLVGSNHLMNLMAVEHLKDGRRLPEAHRRRLEEVHTNLPAGQRRLERGSLGDLEWYWYHLGSGHHFTTPCSPEETDRFFYDPSWAAMTLSLLDRIEAEGYSFGFIGEWGQALSRHSAPAMPAVMEGSFNTGRSRGVYAWMGWHGNPWENDPSILSLAWRSREEIVRRERGIGATEMQGLPAEGLQTAWRHQLMAESSDPLGWEPTPREANYGRILAERAMNAAHRIAAFDRRIGCEDVHATAADETPFAALELYGGQGAYSVLRLSADLQQVDIHLEQRSVECGIRFHRQGAEVVYCPSGLEEEPVSVSVESTSDKALYLPLANGLLAIGPQLSVIRVNRFGMAAARICGKESSVAFGVEGGRYGTVYRWRFLLHSGPLESAVQTANSANLM